VGSYTPYYDDPGYSAPSTNYEGPANGSAYLDNSAEQVYTQPGSTSSYRGYATLPSPGARMVRRAVPARPGVPAVSPTRELLPPPSPASGDGTYPYDGGPANPVPLPKPAPAPTKKPSKSVNAIDGRMVSYPAFQRSRYSYPAYGDRLNSQPSGGDGTVVVAQRGQALPRGR
jgi:hypothetical protein